MFLFGFFIFFTFTVFVDSSDLKIYGGYFAKEGQFPFMVFIREDVIGVQGGGFLVSMDKIITVGHMFYKLPANTVFRKENAFIVAGTIDKSDPKSKGYQMRKMKGFLVHDKYVHRDKNGDVYDIASVEPDSPFEPSPTVARAPIKATKDFKTGIDKLISSKTVCFSIGFGRISESQGESDKLKVIKTITTDIKDCQSKYGLLDPDFLKAGPFCTIPEAGSGESVCKGDSGSPYVCDGYVWGPLLSGGTCGAKKPAFYLPLADYMDYFGITPAATASTLFSLSTKSYFFGSHAMSILISILLLK